jgi:hypothetical protein
MNAAAFIEMVGVVSTTTMSEVEQLAAEGRDCAHSWPREIQQDAVSQLADRRELNRLRGIL